MSDQHFDVIAEKATLFKDRMGNARERAKPMQSAGEFTLVSEFETVPFDGIFFHVDKGQT